MIPYIKIERITQMTFINYFFMPAISVFVLYKLSKCEPKFDAKFLLTYMICSSTVTFFAKCIMLVIKFLFDFDRTEAGGVCFSIAVLFSALVIPFIAKVFKITIKED